MLEVIETGPNLISFRFEEYGLPIIQVVFADGTYTISGGPSFPVDGHSLWQFQPDGKLYFSHPWQDGDTRWHRWTNANDIESEISEQLVANWILEETIFKKD